jgi:hypothetical protein
MTDTSAQQRTTDILRNFKPMPTKLADRRAQGWVQKPGQGWVYDPDYKPQQVAVRVGGGNKFQPGNKFGTGRPKGSKTKLKEDLVNSVRGIMDVMVAKALEGDAAAAALVVNRVLPTLRPQSELVQFTLDADQSISKQVEQVIVAVSKGQVAADTAKKILECISTLANVRAVEDLAKRIEALEDKRI